MGQRVQQVDEIGVNNGAGLLKQKTSNNSLALQRKTGQSTDETHV